ncbi:MAG: C10 family peptidase [Prevotella sp.]|nr:C10 family peptidase [Prevotella sp.]
MFAGPVSKDEAAQKAQAFINGKSKQSVKGARRVKLAHRQMTAVQTPQEDALYYVFNIGEKDGFVIISGDDRTPAVLGYTDNGQFDAADMPDNMRAWLQGYADQLAWLQEHPEVENTIQKSPTKNVVAPLMQSQWNQDAPYYNDCPVFLNGNQSVTGCVATAMAQVMFYHQYPGQTTKEIPSYTYGKRWGQTITENAVPVTTFDWVNMLPVYTSSATDAQNAAVAALMHCCGTSVKMDYADKDNGGSGANSGNIAGAMKTYFDYSATTRYVGRGSYSLSQWNSLIYSELEAGRPVIYGGQSSGGGHAFVVDGYDGDELFHVNWGWGGFRDGYFLLSVLNPGSTAGIGASTSSDGYSFNQDAVIGIQPNHGEEGEEEAGASLTFSGVSISGSNISFAKITNNGGETHIFDFGIGIIDENGNITAKSNYVNSPCAPSNFFSNINFTVNSYWGNGTYKVVPISRVSGTNKWIPDMNPDLEYFEVVINGSSITITHVGAPELSVTAWSFPGNKKAGIEQPVEVTIQNNGSEFYGPLYLFASQTSTKGDAASVSGMTILAGKSFNTQFAFKPTSAGTYNLWVCTDENGNNVIGQSSVEIEAATGTTNLSHVNTVINKMQNGNVLGHSFSGTATFKNNDSEPFVGSIRVRFLRNTTCNSYTTVSDSYTSVDIPSGETVDVNFDFSGLETGKKYWIIYYANESTEIARWNTFLSVAAPEIYQGNGERTVENVQSSYNLDTDVCAFNLTGVSGVTNVTGGNENTLFIFGETDAVPASLEGRNIVKGGEAENITLQDGCDFYSPVTFTAQNISYTRTFATGLSRDYTGWTTIVLPFEVKETEGVKVDVGGTKYPIDWFHSADETKKNFWVMNFDSEEDGVVYYSHAEKMLAARPYIIAVPNASWGSKNDLTNLPITFYGENAVVSGDFRASTSGDNYKMKGVVAKKALNNIYVLNEEGTAFTRQNSAEVEAFRAYFEPTSTAANANMLMVAIGRGEVTALQDLFVDEKSSDNRGIYDLQGRKVNASGLTKGLYIINGKKVVIQ